MFKRKNPAELQAQLASLKGGSSFSSDDKGEWKLKTDNAGSGQAVIRFLPSKDEGSAPFIKLINHGFKKNGKWYIENCTSTFGDYDSCPVCKYMNEHDSYNTNEAEYKLLKRKISYWANILVIKDPANPENEGKVFKYRFGQKIWDKINSMVNVDVEMGEVPVDVTCVYEGANFSLKVKKVGGFQNYDESKFQGQSEISGIDTTEVQSNLEENMVNLSEMISSDKFKAFDVNEAKFKQVMGTSAMGTAASRASAQADKIDNDLNSFDDDLENYNSTKSSDTGASNSSAPTDDDDDDLDKLLDGI